MDEIDTLLMAPHIVRRDEILQAIAAMQHQPVDRDGIEFATDILSMLVLLCRDKEAGLKTVQLAGSARDTLLLITDENSAKAAQWAVFLAAAAGLVAAGNIAAKDIDQITKRMSGLNPLNAAKNAATKRAQAIAAELWQADIAEKIRVSDMAERVYRALASEGFTDSLLDTAERVKEWIKPVAPDYARKGGRRKTPRA